MSLDVPMFDLPIGALIETVDDPATPKLSADRRRTLAQAERISKGLHPLANLVPRLRLHPNAPTDREGEGPRCGTCWYRNSLEYHRRTYGKCVRTEWTVTHSAASDVRAWWPACTEYSAGDPKLSPDAARYIGEAQ